MSWWWQNTVTRYIVTIEYDLDRLTELENTLKEMIPEEGHLTASAVNTNTNRRKIGLIFDSEIARDACATLFQVFDDDLIIAVENVVTEE